jgi:hypothetical protein
MHPLLPPGENWLRQLHAALQAPPHHPRVPLT